MGKDSENPSLISFPRDKDFILRGHDFNRRPWRNKENRTIAFNVFGRRGLRLMDLHYCLDLLKEESNPKIVKQRWSMINSTRREIFFRDLYPSPRSFAKILAGKIEPLEIDRSVFKFVIVNFREILYDVISEHGIDPESIREWRDETFNEIIGELEALSSETG
ncbi:MAG: hypothetical protein ACLFUR_00725 [Candidatus Hadarchaeia archaeon]